MVRGHRNISVPSTSSAHQTFLRTYPAFSRAFIIIPLDTRLAEVFIGSFQSHGPYRVQNSIVVHVPLDK